MTDLELAAYIDRGLSQGDRNRIENHLAFCDECRTAVVAAGEAGRSQRRNVVLRRTTLAAAAAAAIMVAVTSLATERGRETQVRSEGTRAALVVHGPIGEARGTGLRFVWGADPMALSYRLTVSAASGATAWTHNGPDTMATLPDTVLLNAGARYFWTVDAILSSGASRSTGIREFVVAP